LRSIFCDPNLATTPAIDEAIRYPLRAATLSRDVYIDDILTGTNTLKEACQLQKQLIELGKAGGFPLKKWAANNAKLLDEISTEDRMPVDLRK